jgi:hypothetical protein
MKAFQVIFMKAKNFSSDFLARGLNMSAIANSLNSARPSLEKVMSLR